MDNVEHRIVRMPLHARPKRKMNMPPCNVQSIEALLWRIPIGVLVYRDDRCLFWNHEAEVVFGKLNHVLKSGSALRTLIREILLVKEDIDTSCLYVTHLSKPGADRIDVEFSLIEGYGEDVFLVVRDVTELLENREAVSQLDGLLMVGELAAGIAHEIRNPLASIRGFTQMLRTSPTDEDAVQFYTDVMILELDRINEMVEELLQMARPRTQAFEEINLTGILDSVILLLNSQAIMKNCSVLFVSRENVPAIAVQGQPNKLKQVFINIVKNAVEASPNGSTIRISVACAESMVCISVEDQGPGMPEELMMAAGQKFLTTKENGTGLGLMISRNILREHRGRLRFRNVAQGGLEACVTLPIVL